MSKFKSAWGRLMKSMSGRAAVYSHSENKRTGKRSAQRREVIDLEDNELFRSCTTIDDIASAYEAFWALDELEEEKVIVDNVEYPL